MMPSTYVMIAAAVVALSPQSSGALLFRGLAKDARHARFLDTMGRFVQWHLIIFGVVLGKKLLAWIAP